MVRSIFRAIGFILALLGLIALLIILPAFWLGVAENWKVIFLTVGYFCFFLSTIWRVLRYGQLAKREDDRQVKENAGRLASILAIIGLLGVHWLSLYTFSQHGRSLNEIIDIASSITAIIFVIGAIAIARIAIATLGRFFDRLTIKSDHQLVTEGIYSLVRHPIYTSYIVLFLGFCTMLQSLWSLLLLFVTCGIWFGNRIGIEEQMLEEEFGESYRSYCQETKRLFPYIY
ncbi:MAG: isoprenylcysteine carboxylmethyltransferase family protein [Cyanobacteria bacterium P01_E01_bin.42]